MSEVKRAVVMSGGGARGAFQVGMLKTLVLDKGLDFQILRGVSVGSLNAAILAQAPMDENSQANLAGKVEELERLWCEIEDDGSIYRSRFGGMLALLWRDSLHTIEPLRALMEQHIDVEALKNSRRDYASGSVDMVSGKYHLDRPQDPHYFAKLVGSSCAPGVFPRVDLPEESKLLVDGGIRNITPLAEAVGAGATDVYVLLANRVCPSKEEEIPDFAVPPRNYKKTRRHTGLDVIKRTIEILADEVFLEDIRSVLAWNDVIACVNAAQQAGPNDRAKAVIDRAQERLRHHKKRHVNLFVIAPRQWFDPKGKDCNLSPSTKFDPCLIEKAICHGAEVAADESQWLVRPGRTPEPCPDQPEPCAD